MAKAKRASLLDQDSDYFDRMIGDAQEKQAEAKAKAEGKDGRGKPGHSGQKGVDSAGRSKATYGISQAAQDFAREIAEVEEISQADVVEVALHIFHRLYQAGRVDLQPFKAPARSLKAVWKLERLDEIEFF